MSKTLTFEQFCKDNNYYYGNMAITSLKDNTLTSIPKVVDEYFKAKVERITDENIKLVNDLANWSKKYPRQRIYGMSIKEKMDGELIDLEQRAKDLQKLLEQ